MKAAFAYDHDADVYGCPAEQALTHRTLSEQQGLQMRRYWTKARARPAHSKAVTPPGTTVGSSDGTMRISSKPRMPAADDPPR